MSEGEDVVSKDETACQPGGPEFEYRWFQAGPPPTISEQENPRCELCGRDDADQRVTGGRIHPVALSTYEELRSETAAICHPCRIVFDDQPGLAWIMAHMQRNRKAQVKWLEAPHQKGRRRRWK